MYTTWAAMLFTFLKYVIIVETSVALVLILEGVLNVRFGIRTAYVKTLLWLFQFGQKRLDTQRLAIDLYRRPENTRSRMQAQGDLLEDDATSKPLEVTEDQLAEIEPSEFRLSSTVPLVRSGLRAIVEDDVTKAFDAEELPYWNLLTRTNKGYQHISFRLTLLWGFGFFFRHFVLFPIRLIVCLFGLIFLLLSAIVCARLKDGKIRTSLGRYSNYVSFRILARALTLHSTYFDGQNKAKNGSICVANHTSPIDVVVLSCNNVYSFVGQLNGGPFGLLQKQLGRAFDHIYFERGESKDRSLVLQRMQQHVNDHTKQPILIFPEGACVNNTSVMMFKKGSFEVDCPVYPVAIKYNPAFGDAFWGHQPTMQAHIWEMMTSWAIVCKVWYLPPMNRETNEDAAAFANRVRLEIAKKGGLVDIDWDPRFYPDAKEPSESRWRKKQQKVLSERIVGRKSESLQSSGADSVGATSST